MGYVSMATHAVCKSMVTQFELDKPYSTCQINLDSHQERDVCLAFEDSAQTAELRVQRLGKSESGLGQCSNCTICATTNTTPHPLPVCRSGCRSKAWVLHAKNEACPDLRGQDIKSLDTPSTSDSNDMENSMLCVSTLHILMMQGCRWLDRRVWFVEIEVSNAFEPVTDLLNGDVLNILQSCLSERGTPKGTCFCWPSCACAWQCPAFVAADARSLLESLMSGQQTKPSIDVQWPQ